jgi:intracellular sulfur oxidation DsrE/DsrF family protein
VAPTAAQLRTLANGTELTKDELQQFAPGLVAIVDWVSTLPVYPPSIEGWTSEARKAHLAQMEYRMVIKRYVLVLADAIMSETGTLNARSSLEYRLLLEFYWMLHKIPDYLVRTDYEGCCNKLRFLGERKAGFQELWNILGQNSAGVQTMQRRMMLQFGHLEREGCIRLDQVWNTLNNAEMNQAYVAASEQMADLLTTPNEQFQERAYTISQELGQALNDKAKGVTPRVKAQARRERSPSVELVESGARAAGRGKEKEGESRQQKRAREEKGSAQKTVKRTLDLPKPEYQLVFLDEWDKHKQKEGTYRYDHKEWREDGRDPWSIRGNKIGGIRVGGMLYLRIPSVVQVCRKVSGKSAVYEIYVPLPPDGDKGTILHLNSMAKLENLCYTIGDMAMFMPEDDLQGVDIVKKWHDDTKSRVIDVDEAVERLSNYVQTRGDEEVAVEVYGPATEAAQREHEAKTAAEKLARTAGVQVQTVGCKATHLTWRTWLLTPLLKKSRV